MPLVCDVKSANADDVVAASDVDLAVDVDALLLVHGASRSVRCQVWVLKIDSGQEAGVLVDRGESNPPRLLSLAPLTIP
ncbi:hypothetical protein PBI_TRIKE_68 [Mycobacterium phage Trike]|uniref:hypothetical protein n=1 Tax=Mycobacterium phage Trike TaxID=1527536 RepID=UPI0004EF8661|nr:hypothetical protein VC70_gp03 [Mycobacterium phage Trike]AIK69107.1 hypothetical protein PBI_TRIKE_68 [Mycobacterium phage Trike]